MTHKEFYQKAILDNIVHDGLVLTYAKTELERNTIPLRRILIPVLGTLVVLLSVTMAIPAARAEVFSWFGIKTAKDYLTADPDDRTTIESIDQMIVPASVADTHIEILPQSNDEAVNSERAMEVAALISKDFSAEIGDTLFDGEKAYVSIWLSGNAALPLLDGRSGGTLTLVQVDPNLVWNTFEDGPDDTYLSGETPLYERPDLTATLTFQDGSQVSSFLELADDESNSAFFRSIYGLGYDYDSLTDAQQKTIDEMILSYAGSTNPKTILTLAHVKDIIERNADANGYAEAKITLLISVLEDENRSDTTLLTAELGTVRFTATGYQNMENTASAQTGESVSWQGETVITLSERLNADDPEKAVRRLKNFSVSLDGITMRALEGAFIDALGVHNLTIEVNLPDTMSEEQKAAFMQGPPSNPLTVQKILVNGEEGKYGIAEYFGYEKIDEDTVHLVLGGVRGIPLELLSEVKSITVIPGILHVVSCDSNGKTISIPENDWIEFKGDNSYRAESTSYPEFAITFYFE